MTVTAAEVCAWAQVDEPEAESDDEAILLRLIAAVTERAVTLFGFPDPEAAEPEDWTEFQNQVVIEVTAEQYVTGRNSNQGVAEFEGQSPARANSIEYALKRRCSPSIGFA